MSTGIIASLKAHNVSLIVNMSSDWKHHQNTHHICVEKSPERAQYQRADGTTEEFQDTPSSSTGRDCSCCSRFQSDDDLVNTVAPDGRNHQANCQVSQNIDQKYISNIEIFV